MIYCLIVAVIIPQLGTRNLIKINRTVVEGVFETCTETPGRLKEPVEANAAAKAKGRFGGGSVNFVHQGIESAADISGDFEIRKIVLRLGTESQRCKNCRYQQ